MVDPTVTTFDWVPETPRGYVRDIRPRWTLEDVGLPYRVASVPFSAWNVLLRTAPGQCIAVTARHSSQLLIQSLYPTSAET
jgi:hypothetical protein